MKILISAPVYKREWILPDWFAALEQQSIPLEWLGFSFLVSPTDDEETLSFLLDWHMKHPECWAFNIEFNDKDEHTAHHESGSRRWNKIRYQSMVNFRNQLLDYARSVKPDKYFSLDTDILLDDEDTIRHLIWLTDTQCDAAAPLMFMTPNNIMAPSTMTWGKESNRAFRGDYPLGTDFETDVIMAAKMMNPDVYENTYYQLHPQGEDLGWSLVCREKDYKLFCASSVYAPHIMSKDMLETYKKSGDLRAMILDKKLQNSV